MLIFTTPALSPTNYPGIATDRASTSILHAKSIYSPLIFSSSARLIANDVLLSLASPHNIFVFSMKNIGLGTSAYPLAIPLFIMTTCLLFNGCSTGIPAIALPGSIAMGFTVSFDPQRFPWELHDRRTVYNGSHLALTIQATLHLIASCFAKGLTANSGFTNHLYQSATVVLCGYQ